MRRQHCVHLSDALSYCEVQPFIFWPGIPRTEPRQTANVCIMQITSCPHKQAGTNQCQIPFPRPINVIPFPHISGCNRKALFLRPCMLNQECTILTSHTVSLNLNSFMYNRKRQQWTTMTGRDSIQFGSFYLCLLRREH